MVTCFGRMGANGDWLNRFAITRCARGVLFVIVEFGGGWLCDGTEFWVTRYYADCAGWGSGGALTELLATHYYSHWTTGSESAAYYTLVLVQNSDFEPIQND